MPQLFKLVTSNALCNCGKKKVILLLSFQQFKQFLLLLSSFIFTKGHYLNSLRFPKHFVRMAKKRNNFQKNSMFVKINKIYRNKGKNVFSDGLLFNSRVTVWNRVHVMWETMDMKAITDLIVKQWQSNYTYPTRTILERRIDCTFTKKKSIEIKINK